MTRLPTILSTSYPTTWWTRLIVGTAAVLVLFATAGASAVDERASDADRFDQIYSRFQEWYLGEQDERGLAWEHWTLQVGSEPPQRSSRETDYLRVGQGDQRATVVGQRNAEPGWSLDVVHPPGSNADFVLVGDAFRRPALPSEAGDKGPLVTTPWIARPAKGPSRWSPCITSATRSFCDLDRAFARSRNTLPGLPRWAETNPDGTRSARTAIRLVDLVAVGGDPLDERKLANVAPLLHRLVPLTVTETAAGQFLRVQLNGRLSAPGVDLQIDNGLEHSGPAVVSDVPQPPRRQDEVTVMDALTYTRFATEASARTASE